MPDKTHIRVRIPIELDAALQRAMPAYAGTGKAEVRAKLALLGWLEQRGFVDVTVDIPRPAAARSVRRPSGAARVRRPSRRRRRRR